MGKPINNKCLECSKVAFRKDIKHPLGEKPKCYNRNICHKKRCYYRRLDHYRAKLRQYHRYIKFLGDKCLVCGSTVELEAHHIHSQVSGGEDTQGNIVTLCKQCHKVITIYNRHIGIERELME